MAPASAAGAARLKLISVASFGILTGVCALVGYYLLRRSRKASADLNSREASSDGSNKELLSDKQINDVSELAETKDVHEIPEEPSCSREDEAKTTNLPISSDSQDLHPENDEIDANVAEDTDTRKAQVGEAGRDRDLLKDNCVDSLIKLTGDSADTDVRLASLKALVNLSWTTEKHHDYTPVIDQLFANVDNQDIGLKSESLRVLGNLSKNPEMVPHLLAAKAPGCLLKLLAPELDDEMLTIWLSILDDVLWTSKEMCITYASLPTDYRAASPETVYTGLFGLKNSRILKSRIFVLSRHKNQQVTYLASRIYSCLTS